MKGWLLILLLAGLALAEPKPQFPQPRVEDREPIWSASGNLITIDSRDKLWVHDLRSRKTTPYALKENIFQATISPDDKLLAVGTYPHHLQMYALASRERLWEFRGPQGQTQGSYDTYFSPDRRYVMLLSSSHGRAELDPYVRVFEARSGKPVQKWSWAKDHGVDVAWMPDGSVVKADGKSLARFDLATGKKKAQRDGRLLYLQSGTLRLSYQDQHGKIRGARIKDASLQLEVLEESYRPLSHAGLTRTPDDGPVRITRADGSLVWEGEGGFVGWTQDGFAIGDSERKVHLYGAEGQPVGTIADVIEVQDDLPLCWTSVGYGGPLTFYDQKTARPLEKIAWSSRPIRSPDKSKLALLTPGGVLIFTLPQLTWWQP